MVLICKARVHYQLLNFIHQWAKEVWPNTFCQYIVYHSLYPVYHDFLLLLYIWF